MPMKRLLTILCMPALLLLGACADENKYVGEYKDDKRHGQGTATFSSGSKYWENNWGRS